MSRPLAIDLFCGSFGWSAGWLELGGRVVGYDIDHQPHHGPVPHGADLVLQDVRTIDGARFRNASLIVASPPCQEYSYMAMPWSRAKAIAADYRSGARDAAKLTELFDACFRIQREAIVAAGHFIPLVVENVKGAQPWVGRARWHFGSFALWGDVPALMPITQRQSHKYILDDVRAGKRRVAGGVYDGETGRTTKNSGGSWFNVAHNTISGKGQNPDGRLDGVKQGGDWFNAAALDGNGAQSISRRSGSKSNARKAASAQIARIPLALARHIARAYWPGKEERS